MPSMDCHLNTHFVYVKHCRIKYDQFLHFLFVSLFFYSNYYKIMTSFTIVRDIAAHRLQWNKNDANVNI